MEQLQYQKENKFESVFSCQFCRKGKLHFTYDQKCLKWTEKEKSLDRRDSETDKTAMFASCFPLELIDKATAHSVGSPLELV